MDEQCYRVIFLLFMLMADVI